VKIEAPAAADIKHTGRTLLFERVDDESGAQGEGRVDLSRQ
jgi:hypothetical protein